MEQKQKKQSPRPKKSETEVFAEAPAKDFSTPRTLNQANDAAENNYVTKHGGGTQMDSHQPAALGPMDHEA